MLKQYDALVLETNNLAIISTRDNPIFIILIQDAMFSWIESVFTSRFLLPLVSYLIGASFVHNRVFLLATLKLNNQSLKNKMSKFTLESNQNLKEALTTIGIYSLHTFYFRKFGTWRVYLIYKTVENIKCTLLFKKCLIFSFLYIS